MEDRLMPMASQDPLPQAIDFLSQCERCHKMVGDLWLVNGEYICDECYQSHKPEKIVYNFQKVEYNISLDIHKTYGKRWTKWCGQNNDLHPITQEWFCQACNEKQSIELPSYLIRIENQEYARICSVCLHVALQDHLTNIFDLMGVVKPFHPDF